MRYCKADSLSGLGRGISPYLTVIVSVRLRMDRTLRYHNKHQGLWSTECAHQLIPVSVEIVWLVTAVTGELRLQLSDCFLSAMAERLTVRLALETEESG